MARKHKYRLKLKPESKESEAFILSSLKNLGLDFKSDSAYLPVWSHQGVLTLKLRFASNSERVLTKLLFK